MSEAIGYASKTASEIAEEIFLSSSDLYAKPKRASGDSGEVDASTPASTVLLDASLALTPDAEIGNVVIVDNKEFVITDNDATSVTFDSTAQTIVDGTYAFRIMGPAEFLGESSGKNFEVKDDKVQFKTGVPRRLIREDIVERTLSMKGKMSNINAKILKALLGLKAVTGLPDASTHETLRGGSNPSPRPYYEFIIQTKNVNNKTMAARIFYGQIFTDGGIDLDSDKYHELGFTITGYQDPIRIASGITQDEDMFEVKVEK